LAALCKKLTTKALKLGERRWMLRRYDLLHTEMRHTLHQLLAYERPKLQPVGPNDDRVNPQRVKPDLSTLNEAELDQQIILKVGGATAGSGTALGADDADRPPPGTPSPVGGDGTPKIERNFANVGCADTGGRREKIICPSVARPLRKLHFDIKLEQALE